MILESELNEFLNRLALSSLECEWIPTARRDNSGYSNVTSVYEMFRHTYYMNQLQYREQNHRSA